MAITAVQIKKTVAEITKTLSPRNQDILSRRFGLKTGRKETLESIGQSYKITRERVRQIEEFSLAQLAKTASDHPEVIRYSQLAKDTITKSGGVMTESNLFRAWTGSEEPSVANASLSFILALAKEPVRHGETDSYEAFWAVDHERLSSFKNSTTSLVKAIAKHNNLIPHAELASFVQKTEALERVDKPTLDVSLAISKELGKNVFHEVGLTSWPEVKPKGVKDKAYLVLKREKAPRHFTQIAEMINTTSFSSRRANVQTVHNELIKDPRFVLVGRGMYGLSEWGYKPGTVKDVLIDILRNSSRPMARADLVAKARDRRIVKENTILLNLQDSRIFARQTDGTYTLAKKLYRCLGAGAPAPAPRS